MNNYPKSVKTAVESALAKKAVDVLILDMRKLINYADYFIISSGDSELQVRAIADEVMGGLKEKGVKLLNIEGYEEASWVLLDYGEMIMHIFMPQTRSFYELEKLWTEAKITQISEDTASSDSQVFE
jgi:ribosome-associated protein